MRIGSETTMSRCRAEALRVAPGKQNMVLFSVGSKADEYRFDMKGRATRWNPRLLVPRDNRIVPIEGTVGLDPLTPVILVFTPPSDAQKGDLRIDVRRASSGHTESIEFDLDTQVPGPGCFLG